MDPVPGRFKRDGAALCLLSLLRGGEKYGYELNQLLTKSSEGLFTLPEATMYPVMYRLEEQGLVTHEKRMAGKRMQRIYYTLTPEGEEAFAQLREEYEGVQKGIRLALEAGDRQAAEAESKMQGEVKADEP